MDVKLPYVVWREGRPRFVPPTHVSKLGFKGHDLKHGTGAWYTLDETSKWAELNLAKIKAARGGDKPKLPSAAARLTVGELMLDWCNSKHVKGLSPATQRNYLVGAEVCIYKPTGKVGPKARDGKREPEEFGLEPVASVGKAELRAFFDYVCDARSLEMARLAVNSFSTAYMWATEDLRWKLPAHMNPRKGMRFEGSKGRISVIEPKEFKALVEAADRIGRPSIGDAIYLGFYTGQRLGDRLKFAESYEDGRRKLRQGKTDAVVRVYEVPALKARLAEARKRARELSLKFGTRHKNLLLNELNGKPWHRVTYRHWFARVRAEAAKTVPSCAKRTDQDLRDTCVTMLSRSGARDHTICDVTGHSYKSVALILKHYLGHDPRSADAALDRMAALVEAELA
jgi:hypothetical protein